MPEFAPSEGIKDTIDGDAAITGWSIVIGQGLTDVDELITIVDTGGLPSNPKWLLDFPTVQVLVRGGANNYLNTWRVAKAVKDLCLGLTSTDINGDRYVSITQLSDLAFIGRDDNNRPTFSMNFSLIIEPQTNAQTNRTAL